MDRRGYGLDACDYVFERFVVHRSAEGTLAPGRFLALLSKSLKKGTRAQRPSRYPISELFLGVGVAAVRVSVSSVSGDELGGPIPAVRRATAAGPCSS